MDGIHYVNQKEILMFIGVCIPAIAVRITDIMYTDISGLPFFSVKQQRENFAGLAGHIGVASITVDPMQPYYIGTGGGDALGRFAVTMRCMMLDTFAVATVGGCTTTE